MSIHGLLRVTMYKIGNWRIKNIRQETEASNKNR